MKLRKWSEEDYGKAVQLYQKGCSVPEIEELTGMPQGTLYYYFKKTNVKTRSRKEGFALAFLRGRFKKSQLTIPKDKWKLAYLAGLIDGEGSVFLRHGWTRRRILPMVRVSNTDPKMIRWIHENFGGTERHVMKPTEKERRTGKRKKPLYRWETDSILACKALLDAVLPFLITKKQNGEKVLAFCNDKLRQYKSKVHLKVEKSAKPRNIK